MISVQALWIKSPVESTKVYKIGIYCIFAKYMQH